jgi:Mg-chelatase subunit ChlD
MRKRPLRSLVRLGLAFIVLASAVPLRPALATTCSDVHVVWARGANVNINFDDFNGFVRRDLEGRIQAPVTVTDYQLGDVGFNGYKYLPANELDLIANFLGGILPYALSTASGRDELSHYLIDRSNQCPNEVYVLGGWSEGAEVMSGGLFDLPQSLRNRIAFVALFGDVKLDTGNFGPFQAGCNGGKKPWIRGSLECGSSGGFFGPRSPYVPADIETRVGSWCRDRDPACTGDITDLAEANPGGQHFQYFLQNSDAAWAAREAAVRLQVLLPSKAASFNVSYDQFVSGQAGADLAIVFDTTGSMGGSIANAQSQATALAQKWLSLFSNGRVGLADFKDLDQGDPYAARVDLALTNDVNAFQNAVNGLSASGGGDTPEAQLNGIMTTLDGMSWANGATKAVVVITDAPGKDPEPGTNNTRASVAQHARSLDPVAIYGVNVSSSQSVADWMAPLATGTAGDVVTLAPGQALADALTALFNSVHANPVAILDSPMVVQTGTVANFNAAQSFDASTSITTYNWDFNGDGVSDRTTSAPTTSYTYPSTFAGVASVEVVASDGRSALATASVTVDNVGRAGALPLTPTAATAAVTGTNQVTVSWTPAASDRAAGYKIALTNGTVVRVVRSTDPHSIVINDIDTSQPMRLNVRSTNTVGDSGTVQTPLFGSDTTAPVSSAGALAATYTTSAVAVPFSASDTGGSGVSSVELWSRYRLNESHTWGVWAKAITGTTSPVTFNFTTGDGNYEFYTVAVDGAGNREAAPATADSATRRDAVDDPPDASSSLGASRDSTTYYVVGSGTAADDRTNVTVQWRLYGVKSNGSRTKIFDFANATPTDGTFNSRIEGYSASWSGPLAGYVNFDIDIKVVAAAQSTTTTTRIPIRLIAAPIH